MRLFTMTRIPHFGGKEFWLGVATVFNCATLLVAYGHRIFGE